MTVLKALVPILALLFAASVPVLAKPGGNPAPGGCIAVPKGQTIPIEVAATDNVAVTKVEFYVDSQLIATFLGAPSTHYKTMWNVPKRNKATYRLLVLGYDGAGNVGSASICMAAVR